MTVEYFSPFAHYVVNESRALERKLEGIRLKASTAPKGKTVPVQFVMGDYEFTAASFPGIYIRLGLVARATDREHRGPILLPYAPEGKRSDVLVHADMDDTLNLSTVPWIVDEDSVGDLRASPYKVPDVPVPFDINFDISVLTRNYDHAGQIVNVLADFDRLPPRFGYLEVPEDGTVRTLSLTGGPEIRPLRDRSDKRYFETLYSITVTSELSVYPVTDVKRASEIDVVLETL